MDSEHTYKTIQATSEAIYKEKGSKFLAFAVPCTTEEQIKEQLEVWRKSHSQANHVCYAYKLGFKGEQYRANDDGEPSNSAGQPILGQLSSFEVTNVLIGVVRYFGGTKLGVGGLIHAYRTSAKEALENATIETRSIQQILELHFTYEEMPAVMNIVKHSGANVMRQDFELDCTLTVAVSPSDKETFSEKFELLQNVTITDKGLA